MGTELVSPLFAAQRNGRVILRDTDDGGSPSSFSESYLVPTSTQRTYVSSVYGALYGTITWVRKGGEGLNLRKMLGSYLRWLLLSS